MSVTPTTKSVKRSVGTKNRLTLPKLFNQGDLIELDFSEDFINGKTQEFSAKRVYQNKS